MKSLLVWRGGAIGDTVLTLPAISALRRRFPQARLTLLGNPHYLSIVTADRVLDHNRSEFASLFSSERTSPHQLRELLGDTDLLIAYMAEEDGLQRKLRQLATQVIMHSPLPDPVGTVHAVDHLLRPIEALGIAVPERVPHLEPPHQADQYLAEIAKQQTYSSPLVVLHPGSGGTKKRWPLNRFNSLIERFRDLNLAVAILLGPAEPELEAQIADEVVPEFPVVQPSSLEKLIAFIHKADLFVGNDSGPTHIAAALQLPTLALFGPTEPNVWGPRGPRVSIIRSATGRMCSLAVDEVFEIAAAILGMRGDRLGSTQNPEEP